MRYLLILNDPPYGSERCYNALRLAHALVKADSTVAITLFLMADAVLAAKQGQTTPDGYYNLERMLKRFVAGDHMILLCGTCMMARGLDEADIMPGAQRSSMDALAQATLAADQVMVF